MFGIIDAIIVRPITNILFVIYGVVGDFGLAIILFTVLVKLCMWPLVKKQMRQTRLMRKIQPELAEIKKNCNGNRQMESLQMMDLYKKNNIKPFSSVVTILIQLPIFIALYTAIRVMVLPTTTDNLSIRAYEPIRKLDRIEEVIETQNTYIPKLVEYNEQSKENPDMEKPELDFRPKLFGLVDLSAHPGFRSVSSLIMLAFALASALTQYWVSRQQMPSKKSKGAKTFRQLMKEAADGKEPDQAELTQAMTGQMSFMMPAMMLLIMINLPGALVFYYFVNNLFTMAQQKFLLAKVSEEMEESADKRIIKELKNIQEGKVVAESKNNQTNQTKSGAKITRISAKSQKRFKKKRS